MKKILLLIILAIPFWVNAQTQPPNQTFSGLLYEFKYALRADSVFLLPRNDTTSIRVSLLAPGAMIYRTADKTFYGYDGQYWVKFASGTQLAIDSVYRSSDSIIFRRTTGPNIGIKLNNIPQSGVIGLIDSVARMTLQGVTEKGNTTTVNIKANGGLDATGNLNLGLDPATTGIRTNRSISQIGNATTGANGAFIQWFKSNGGKVGYVGDASSSDNDIYLTGTDSNSIRIGAIVVDTPLAPAKYPAIFRPDGKTLFGELSSSVNIGSNLASFRGNVQVYNTLSTPPQIEFARQYNSRVWVGMLGNPEANLSFNMNYTTSVHKYGNDSTIGATWLALGESTFAIQWAQRGQPHTSSPGYDIWTNSTHPLILLATPTATRIYQRTTIDTFLQVNTQANTLGFRGQRYDQNQGITMAWGSGLYTINNFDSANSVFPSYVFNSTKGTVTNQLVRFDGVTGNVGIGVSTAPNSTLNIQGSASFAVRTSATGVTLGSTDYYLNINNTTNIVVTLPTAIGIAGRTYVVKKTTNNGNTITFNTTSSQTIDGGASGTLSLGAFNAGYTFFSDGSNWFIKN